MKKIVEKANLLILNGVKKVNTVLQEKRGVGGIEVVLGIAVVIIIFGFVIIPMTRAFTGDVFTEMDNWWDSLNIFPVS